MLITRDTYDSDMTVCCLYSVIAVLKNVVARTVRAIVMNTILQTEHARISLFIVV